MSDIPTGPALDARISERVMGGEKRAACSVCDRTQIARYSADITAAWRVVERITDVRQPFNRPPERAPEDWLPPATRFAYAFDAAHLWASSEAEAAESICRLALDALEESARG